MKTIAPGSDLTTSPGCSVLATMPYLSPKRSQPEGMCCWPRHWKPETPLTSPVASMATTVPTGGAGGCACRGLPPNQLDFRSTGGATACTGRGVAPGSGTTRTAPGGAFGGISMLQSVPEGMRTSMWLPGAAPSGTTTWTILHAARGAEAADCRSAAASGGAGRRARSRVRWRARRGRRVAEVPPLAPRHARLEAALPQDLRGKTENAVTCRRIARRGRVRAAPGSPRGALGTLKQLPPLRALPPRSVPADFAAIRVRCPVEPTRPLSSCPPPLRALLPPRSRR
mmetsp:Transcript_6383/g.17952  ORF Transcript_6383/g.17952 Transcript_6383/m.17952 type:complete len:284 (+) Transcript_6383:686-1537(+)